MKNLKRYEGYRHYLLTDIFLAMDWLSVTILTQWDYVSGKTGIRTRHPQHMSHQGTFPCLQNPAFPFATVISFPRMKQKVSSWFPFTLKTYFSKTLYN